MTAKREGLAHSVQARLATHAKKIGVDPNLVLARYGAERFLYRLSRSQYADQFILKGALLLLVWLGETLRPTRDVDLLGFGDLSDDALVSVFREVCSAAVEPDGMTFHSDSVSIEPIRDEDAYGGRRITLRALLGAPRVKIQVDIGIGDAVTPEPQWLDYPTLLDQPRPRLRAYPRETVVAEKLHAIVLLGMRNSRMKDYFDLYALGRENALDDRELTRAITATFARRRTPLPDRIPTGLSEDFAADATKQGQWRAFLNKNQLEGPPFPEVVSEIRSRIVVSLGIGKGTTPVADR